MMLVADLKDQVGCTADSSSVKSIPSGIRLFGSTTTGAPQGFQDASSPNGSI